MSATDSTRRRSTDERLAAVMPELRRRLRDAELRPMSGRVSKVVGTMVHAALADARIGDVCRIRHDRGDPGMLAEIVGISGEGALLTPIGEPTGLSTRAAVVPTGRPLSIVAGPHLLGRVVDALGAPIDADAAPVPASADAVAIPLDAPPPNPLTRAPIGTALPIGLRVLDGLLTCGRGQRVGIYGEPGAGKSSLLARIVNGASADIAVMAVVGERGREVREFIDRHLTAAGRARSVLVVATSDRSPMERVKAAYAATAIAEYFRDRGETVLLLIDSVTRFARAQREIGLAAGEPPTRRGFPPSVFTALPRLMERAGNAGRGSITAFYAVLVEGDGTGDPIAEETRGILDGHIVLAKRLADGGHFPAVDALASRSRVMNQVVDPGHLAAAERIRALMAKHAEVELLLQVGEYQSGSDTLADESVAKIDRIRAFLRQGTEPPTAWAETIGLLEALAA